MGLRFAEIVLGGGMFLVILNIGSALFTPVPLPQPPAAGPVTAPEIQFAAFEAYGNPFSLGRAAGSSQNAAPLKESALNLKLYGTWIGTGGGAAIVSLDGAPQKKIAAGEEIAAGIRLESVRDDFVVINNQGVREAAAIVNRKVAIGAYGAPIEENEVLDTPPAGIALRDAPAGENLRQGTVLPDLATYDASDANDSADAISPDETD